MRCPWLLRSRHSQRSQDVLARGTMARTMSKRLLDRGSVMHQSNGHFLCVACLRGVCVCGVCVCVCGGWWVVVWRGVAGRVNGWLTWRRGPCFVHCALWVCTPSRMLWGVGRCVACAVLTASTGPQRCTTRTSSTPRCTGAHRSSCASLCSCECAACARLCTARPPPPLPWVAGGGVSGQRGSHGAWRSLTNPTTQHACITTPAHLLARTPAPLHAPLLHTRTPAHLHAGTSCVFWALCRCTWLPRTTATRTSKPGWPPSSSASRPR